MVIIYNVETGRIEGRSDQDFTVDQLYPNHPEFKKKYRTIQVDKKIFDNRENYKVVDGEIIEKDEAELEESHNNSPIFKKKSNRASMNTVDNTNLALKEMQDFLMSKYPDFEPKCKL